MRRPPGARGARLAEHCPGPEDVKRSCTRSYWLFCVRASLLGGWIEEWSGSSEVVGAAAGPGRLRGVGGVRVTASCARIWLAVPWCTEVYGPMLVLVVVVGEELLAERADGGKAAEPGGEDPGVLQGLKLGLAVGVVVGHVRVGAAAGD